MLRFALALAAFSFTSFSLLRPIAAEERVWNDTQGRTMRAEFLREVDGEAVFLKDGKIITLPLERFAEADREVMKKLAAGKPISDESAPEDPFRPVARPAPPAPSGGFASAAPLVKERTDIVSREWIDAAGNRTTGKFVRVVGRDVLILRGVRTIVVAFDKLSFVDQSYVNQILDERGQRLLSPATTSLDGQPPGGQSPDRPDQIVDPRSPDGSSADDGPVVPGNSQFFRELRERQDEARQQQAEFADANPDAGESPPANDPEKSIEPAEFTPVAQSPTTPKPGKISTRTVIKAETLAELRPVLIVGLVVIGLFGAVGFIVFIATSLAASNAARRRRYL